MADEDGWLDGWEHVNVDAGLSWTGGPGKLTLHTTEPVGATMNGLVHTFRRNPTIASHTGICWKERRKVQFISLLHSAKALRNLPGGVQTNRDQVYQIEIVGSWVESEDLPEHALQFIGECIAEIWLATGGAFRLEAGPIPFPGPQDGYTARVSSPFRYTPQEWDNFNAIAGHGNVPENEHTDPGKLDMYVILHYAKAKINGANPQKLPEEAMIKQLKNKDGRVELIQLGTDGYFYTSYQNASDGKLTAWTKLNPNQPFPFYDGDAGVAEDGRLWVIGLANGFGGIPFFSAQTAPSVGPWTEWVQFSDLLAFIHSLSKK